MKRTPRNYDGSAVTTHHLSVLCSGVLSGIRAVYEERPDLILAAWPEVIGHKLANMTQAVSFVDGVMLVKVNNAPLHSLLNQPHDRNRILKRLREQFPKAVINGIVFRRG